MIPDEVMLRCIGYLCPVDIARLVATCRRFNNCWLNCGGSMWYDDLDGKKSVPSEWKWLSVVCRGPVGAHSKTEGLLSPTVSLEICPHLLEIRIDFREHLEYCSGVAWDFGDPSKTPSLCVMRLRVCFTSQQDVDTASRFGILSFRYSSEPLQALVLWCETADDSSEARQGAANCLIDSLFWGANRVLCTWGNENDRSVGAAHLRDAIPRAFPAERQCSSFTCPNLEMVFWRAEQVPGGLMCDLTEISSLESLLLTSTEARCRAVGVHGHCTRRTADAEPPQASAASRCTTTRFTGCISDCDRWCPWTATTLYVSGTVSFAICHTSVFCGLTYRSTASVTPSCINVPDRPFPTDCVRLTYVCCNVRTNVQWPIHPPRVRRTFSIN